MKIIKLFRLVFLLLCFCSVTFAQTNDEQARQKYQEAKTAYDNKDYLATVKLLVKARELLGSIDKTNVRIQPMLIKSLAKINAWSYIKAEVDSYLALKPDTTLVEYREVIKISENADANLKRDEAAYQEILNNPTNDSFENYFANFPYGLHLDNVNWMKAKKENSFDSYYKYINLYPSGKHILEAIRITSSSDSLQYQKAIKEGNLRAYQDYLTGVPRGMYKNEINKLIREKMDEEAYTKAYNNSSISDLEKYIHDYPDGKNVTSAQLLMQEIIISKSDKYYKEENWYSAKYNYKLYVSKFPGGDKRAYAEQQIIKCDRMTAKDDRRASTRRFFKNITPYALGIGVGALLLLILPY